MRNLVVERMGVIVCSPSSPGQRNPSTLVAQKTAGRSAKRFGSTCNGVVVLGGADR